MKEHIPDSLDRILSDKVSGSSELTLKLNKFFLKNINNRKLIRQTVMNASRELNHFSSVINYLHTLNRLIRKGNQSELINFLLNYDQQEDFKYTIIAKKLFAKFKYLNTILTISRSGTLLKVLTLLKRKNRKLKVIVSESRPAFEGRLMAKSLLKSGIKVDLITDAMTGIHVQKCDAVVVGADKILSNGNVVNKVGSLSLALLCREFSKPFVVVSTKSKFSKEKKFRPKFESPFEVWNYEHKNLKVNNIYFEEISKKLITDIITN